MTVTEDMYNKDGTVKYSNKGGNNEKNVEEGKKICTDKKWKG